jgi:DNA-binding NarL/FixJ family response regulator
MKHKVIICDDHHLFNDGLTLLLKESNKFDVVSQLYDSRSCYTQCHSLMPDLVLLDYNMPHMNGIEVTMSLKKLIRVPKIVVITMYSNAQDEKKFYDLGVDGFIAKTTPADTLIQYLLNVMAGERVFPKNAKRKFALINDEFDIKKILTNRELDILVELKKGMTTQEIADSLGLSYYTVETHRKNMNKKLSFDTKMEYYQFLKDLNIE